MEQLARRAIYTYNAYVKLCLCLTNNEWSFYMSEVLSPELFEQDLSETQFAEVIGDLSISSVMSPEGNSPEGYGDGPPQLGYDRSLKLL